MVSNRFYPQYSQISAITNDVQAEITFTASHDFTVGQIVGFRVTKDFGMKEINNKRGKVLTVGDTTITVDINTQDWTAFTTAKLDEEGTTPPLCVPYGAQAIPNNNPPQVNINAAFDNRRV